jgi:hypothetical protein
VQLVEDVEEHLLCFLAAGEELHVIQYQQVYLQVIVLKLLHLVVLQGVEELRGEIVLINIQGHFARHVVFDLVANGLYEVGLAYPYATV